jgi:hypothetical protein
LKVCWDLTLPGFHSYADSGGLQQICDVEELGTLVGLGFIDGREPDSEKESNETQAFTMHSFSPCRAEGETFEIRMHQEGSCDEKLWMGLNDQCGEERRMSRRRRRDKKTKEEDNTHRHTSYFYVLPKPTKWCRSLSFASDKKSIIDPSPPRI